MAWHAVEVRVVPRKEVRDPQADAIAEALRTVDDAPGLCVRQVGRVLRLEVDALTPAAAKARIEKLCQTLLVNPHLETYSIDVSSCSALDLSPL